MELSGIDVSGFTQGVHMLYVRFMDDYGRWGAVASREFQIIGTTDDQDGDGMPNGWENDNGLNPIDPNDGLLDNDNDGLVNKDEYDNGTNPNLADSDHDGPPDGWEHIRALGDL